MNKFENCTGRATGMGFQTNANLGMGFQMKAFRIKNPEGYLFPSRCKFLFTPFQLFRAEPFAYELIL